ncbi:MAG: YfiR family protein [Panacagrimonas sp.]|jgi:hypothetical protein|nr:YfiR family protein [Panacagrimonas sp.]MCC2657048.1 YfiR family protein [Panacagrimonas sp.]
MRAWASNTARRRRRGIACIALLAAMVIAPCSLADDRYDENAVKAAFLYRFTGYVDWPRDALAGPNFTLAILDGDAVAGELTRLLPGHPIKNLPTQVRTVRSAKEAADAQLLYVGPAYAGDLAAVVVALANRPVLVITDRADALNSGSAINFMLVDRRVRFEISMPSVVRSRLWVQPPLLAVAARVRGIPRGDGARVVPGAPTRPQM